MYNYKRLTVAVMLLAFVCVVSLMQPVGAYTTSTVNYRLLSSTQTVNDETGYILRDASASSNASATQNIAGSATVTFAYKAWLCYIDEDTPTLLTGISEVDFAARPSTGEGYQTANVTVTEQTLVAGYTNLKLAVYVKFDDGEYLPVAYFVSDQIIEKKLNAATWSFTLYTKSVQNASGTYATAVWGSSAAYSRLSGVAYTDLLPQEKGLITMATGEWVYGVFLPYAFLISYPILWGVTMLFLGAMVYGRYRRFEPVLVMGLLYGGSGGLGLLIPEVGYRLLYIIVVFVITVILYRVFR